MEYLTAQNKVNALEISNEQQTVTAKDKVVVVIGGGDTGSDCVGTAQRQGAKKIYQFEILPKPPESRPVDTPWPMWPRIMRTSSSHEEGCERRWSISTKAFTGGTSVTAQKLHACEVEWFQKKGQWKIKELPGTDFSIDVDLVILATGFVHVVHEGLIKDMALELDKKGNIAVNNFQTSNPQVFAAGDTMCGPSLVVHAIDTGRRAAAAIDKYLRKSN